MGVTSLCNFNIIIYHKCRESDIPAIYLTNFNPYWGLPYFVYSCLRLILTLSPCLDARNEARCSSLQEYIFCFETNCPWRRISRMVQVSSCPVAKNTKRLYPHCCPHSKWSWFLFFFLLAAIWHDSLLLFSNFLPLIVQWPSTFISWSYSRCYSVPCVWKNEILLG